MQNRAHRFYPKQEGNISAQSVILLYTQSNITILLSRCPAQPLNDAVGSRAAHVARSVSLRLVAGSDAVGSRVQANRSCNSRPYTVVVAGLTGLSRVLTLSEPVTEPQIPNFTKKVHFCWAKGACGSARRRRNITF